jgi:hypothetical protein
MLREITGVRQDDPGLSRRWFQDDYFDLFLWVTPAGRVSAFQLAYRRAGQERVLSWSGARGSATPAWMPERRPVSYHDPAAGARRILSHSHRAAVNSPGAAPAWKTRCAHFCSASYGVAAACEGCAAHGNHPRAPTCALTPSSSASISPAASPLYAIHGEETLLALEAADRIRQRCHQEGYSEREV